MRRNSLCPCGSGKKLKKCCLFQSRRAEIIKRFTTRVLKRGSTNEKEHENEDIAQCD